MRERIKTYFDAHRGELIADIGTLVSFRSLTDDPNEVQRAFEWVMEKGEKLGFRTGVTSQRKAGYIEYGEGSELVGMPAHVDVVGVGDMEKWGAHEPFTLYNENGLLYGRGVVDDKGPLILALYALRFLKDEHIPVSKRIRLIVGTSEESQWTDMAEYKAEFGVPDYGFSPDGDFPIANIEKGYCDAVLTFSGGWLKDIEYLSAGDSPNTVPSRAEIRLAGGGASKVYSGKAIHSSVPWHGDNAILKLALDNPRFPFSKFITEFFTNEYHGVKLGVDDGSDTYDGVFVSKTTACPTVMRITDRGVELNINIRARAGRGEKDIRAAIESHMKDYSYTWSLTECTEPGMVSPDLPFLRDMNRLYEEYGYKGEFVVAEGASYASTMKNCVCWGPIFPGEYSCAHQENEQIITDSLIKCGCLYTEFLTVTAGR